MEILQFLGETMIDSNYLTKEVENTQVNLLVGGKAKRMNEEIKCLLKINGTPLIERTLKQYADLDSRNSMFLPAMEVKK